MSSWAEMHRAGTRQAIERLGARRDLPDLLLRFDAWLEAIGTCDEADHAAVVVHPATGILADTLEAADLQDEAAYLRAFTIVTGPIRPGVWIIAQLLGRASAQRFTAGLVGQTRNKPRLFGLESYGAFDAFREEAADILRRDATAKAAVVAESTGRVAEACQKPGNFAVFKQEQAGVEEAVQDYQNMPAIKEAWETRLDSHVRFGSTLLGILSKVDAAEFLRQVGALPHPVFAEQVLPEASHLSEDDLLCLLRDAPVAFDDTGLYRAAGMTVVRLLHRVGEKIRLAAWGARGAVPVPPEEQDQLDPLRAETERVIAQHLDILFVRTDAAYLAWAWLARLIYEGEHRGYWRAGHRCGDGIVLDPLIMLIVALARRLEPRPGFEGWVRDVRPLWQIERAMAGIAVNAFALQPDRIALQRLLEWTLATLAPAFPGAADAVLRPNGVIGRIGAYGLLGLDQPGNQLMRLWQIVRPLREQAWRISVADDDHHNVAQMLIVWGLDAVAAAPPGTQQPLWSAFDEMLRDAAQVDRVTFHGEFWPNVLQRYGRIVVCLLSDTPDPLTRLARTVRFHVRPDYSFVQFVLTFVRAGGDRLLMQAAVAEVGTDLSLTLRQFRKRSVTAALCGLRSALDTGPGVGWRCIGPVSGPMTSPHIIVAGTRRSWSPEQKRAILAEADDPATTASAVARRHGLHSSLLFRWRRAVLAEPLARTVSAPPAFVPLALPPPAAAAAEKPAGLGMIEIELAGGHRLRAEVGADLALLQGVIAALLGR